LELSDGLYHHLSSLRFGFFCWFVTLGGRYQRSAPKNTYHRLLTREYRGINVYVDAPPRNLLNLVWNILFGWTMFVVWFVSLCETVHEFFFSNTELSTKNDDEGIE